MKDELNVGTGKWKVVRHSLGEFKWIILWEFMLPFPEGTCELFEVGKILKRNKILRYIIFQTGKSANLGIVRLTTKFWPYVGYFPHVFQFPKWKAPLIHQWCKLPISSSETFPFGTHKWQTTNAYFLVRKPIRAW